MKVNLLVYSIELGGAELHTIQLASLLSARGHQVTIIEHGNGCYAANLDLFGGSHVDIRNYPWNLSVPFAGYSQFLKNHRADAGLLVKGLFTVGGARTDLAAWLHHRRLVTIEHALPDPMPVSPLTSLRRKVNSLIRSRFPRRVVCVSDAIRRQLEVVERYPGSKMVTVRHGIDPNRYVPGADLRARARAAWGIPETALVFGTVGRLSPEKGVGTAIASFARLRAEETGRDAWLVVAGEGIERASLARAAGERGIAERVCFLGFQKRPWEVYPGLDCLLMPSVREGFGLTLLEAMACGCPCIAMDVGGIPEVVSSPSVGWLVPAGDPESFAHAMVQAAHLSDDARGRMSRAAREHAVSRFNRDAGLERIIRILEG